MKPNLSLSSMVQEELRRLGETDREEDGRSIFPFLSPTSLHLPIYQSTNHAVSLPAPMRKEGHGVMREEERHTKEREREN